MSEATCGTNLSAYDPAYRFAHAGYLRKPTLRCPYFLAGAGYAFRLMTLAWSEGSRAPTGAGAERRTRWPALRSGRSLDRQGSPANDAGQRASRRSTRRVFCLRARASVAGIGAGDRAASTSQSGRNTARHDARSRPSAGLRGLPAGAAPRSIRRTSPEDAPQRARCGKYT